MKKYNKHKRDAYEPICGCAREIVEYLNRVSPGCNIDPYLMDTALLEGYRNIIDVRSHPS